MSHGNLKNLGMLETLETFLDKKYQMWYLWTTKYRDGLISEKLLTFFQYKLNLIKVTNS